MVGAERRCEVAMCLELMLKQRVSEETQYRA